MAYLFPDENQPQRISIYKKYINKVKYDKIDFPVKIKDIPKSENLNDDIRFNVYGVTKDQTIYPLYTSNKNCDKTCNLHLIENGNENHYVWIKDFNKLTNSQSKNGHRLFSCYYCLQHFTSEEILKNHAEGCHKINGTQKVKMPCKNKNIFFMNYHKQLMAPFVIYADFECITVPINEKHGNNTEAYQEHKACGFGYKIVSQYDAKYSKPTKIYRGPDADAVYKLIENLLKEEKEKQNIVKQNFNKETIISEKEKNDFKIAKSCHIRNKEYKKEDALVRDHCHVTGKYRGSAHANCNLSYRLTHIIYVIFHNLRGYDSHLIMQEIGKFNKDINVIPYNMEKYMTFMIGSLIFTDSFQFMNQSLSNLANNLPKDGFYNTEK